MKRWVGLAALVFVGGAGWRIGDMLSSDALSMAVGVLFGVMAGVPTALLLMASGRRSEDRVAVARGERAMQPWSAAGYMAQPSPSYQSLSQQPPVIVLAAPQGLGAQARGSGMSATWSPDAFPARRFKVVGEQEAWLDEW